MIFTQITVHCSADCLHSQQFYVSHREHYLNGFNDHFKTFLRSVTRLKEIISALHVQKHSKEEKLYMNISEDISIFKTMYDMLSANSVKRNSEHHKH